VRLVPLLVVGLLCVASSARAQQPSKQFLDEYQKGIDAYRLGKFDEAKQHLEGPWRFLGAIAQAEQRFGDCVASTREAIRLNPTSSEIDATKKVHDECRASWGKPDFAGPYDVGQGAISINSDPAGAAIELSGLAYGATPIAPRTLAVGPVDITLTKTGYLPKTMTIEILPGVVTDVDVTLEEDPNVKGQGGIGEAPPEITTGWIKVETTVPSAIIEIDGKQLELDAQGRYLVEQGEHAVEVRAQGHEAQSRRVRVTKGQMVTVRADLRSAAVVSRTKKIGGIAIGTGAGLVAVGAVTAVLSLRAQDKARDWANIERSRPNPMTVPLDESTAIQPLHTREDIAKKQDDAKRFALISHISYGAAAVAIGVGAYFLIKGRPADGRRERRSLTLVPVLDGDRGIGAAALGEVRW
jgi:hypothetical protein